MSPDNIPKVNGPPITTDHLIMAYMGARMPIGIMAAKLGMTEDAIRQRHADLTRVTERMRSNGMPDLFKFLSNVALHYQQLGIGLEQFANFLDNSVPVDDIRSLLTGNPETDARNIAESFIVLRPFELPPGEESEPQTQDQNEKPD
jgi:hypothetical protein